jgi:hypothetical protein
MDLFRLMVDHPFFTIILLIIVLGGLSDIASNFRGKR